MNCPARGCRAPLHNCQPLCFRHWYHLPQRLQREVCEGQLDQALRWLAYLDGVVPRDTRPL